MLTKKQIQRFQKLQQKKYRLSEGLFVAEGEKNVQALVQASYSVEALYSSLPQAEWGCETISEGQMKQLTFLKNPSPYFGVFKIPVADQLNHKGLVIALDGISDPGNLGTIIRLCDWFGVPQIWCSLDTVDCYNPKVVQATMGSLGRVSCLYIDLAQTLEQTSLPVYGTFLEGRALGSLDLASEAVVVMGSESHGISDAVSPYVDQQMNIPKYEMSNPIDSLNVGTAAAIVLAAFRS